MSYSTVIIRKGSSHASASSATYWATAATEPIPTSGKHRGRSSRRNAAWPGPTTAMQPVPATRSINGLSTRFAVMAECRDQERHWGSRAQRSSKRAGRESWKRKKLDKEQSARSNGVVSSRWFLYTTCMTRMSGFACEDLSLMSYHTSFAIYQKNETTARAARPRHSWHKSWFSCYDLSVYSWYTFRLCHTNFGINPIIETARRAKNRKRLDR